MESPHRSRVFAIASALVSIVAASAIAYTVAPAIAFAQHGETSQPPVRYATGPGWDADSLGNHRVIVHVDAAAAGHSDAVHAYIPWRRRDTDPKNKNIVVIDATTGARVMNVVPFAITRESGDIVFGPVTTPGDYDVYFMPYRRVNKSANYPKIVYETPQSTADEAWLRRNHLADANTASTSWKSLPTAHVVAYQSVDSLDAFTPMEIIATRKETQALLSRNPDAAYLVFPEDRSNSIRMSTDFHSAGSMPAPTRRSMAPRSVVSFTYSRLESSLRDRILRTSALSSVILPARAEVPSRRPASRTSTREV